MRIATEAQIRREFWETHYADGMPHRFRGLRQNELPAEVRTAFLIFVDELARAGRITKKLASGVTL